jgi:hypothetical protein
MKGSSHGSHTCLYRMEVNAVSHDGPSTFNYDRLDWQQEGKYSRVVWKRLRVVCRRHICSARIELRHQSSSKCQPGLEPKPHVDLAVDGRLAKHIDWKLTELADIDWILTRVAGCVKVN